MSIFRVFVEKKNEFAVEAEKLKSNLFNVLGLKKIEHVRIFNRYDISGISESVFNLALNGVLSEPQVDDFYFNLPKLSGFWLATEFLPGQFDSRASFCQQCIQLIDFKAEIEVKTAKIFFFSGIFSEFDVEKIKRFLINPIECREVLVNEPVNFTKLDKTGHEV